MKLTFCDKCGGSLNGGNNANKFEFGIRSKIKDTENNFIDVPVLCDATFFTQGRGCFDLCINCYSELLIDAAFAGPWMPGDTLDGEAVKVLSDRRKKRLLERAKEIVVRGGL